MHLGERVKEIKGYEKKVSKDKYFVDYVSE
jgi:hypothetical protein